MYHFSVTTEENIFFIFTSIVSDVISKRSISILIRIHFRFEIREAIMLILDTFISSILLHFGSCKLCANISLALSTNKDNKI